jgi:hypothetical protein
MEIEEKPVPTEARQSTSGPLAAHEVPMLSAETPLRFGPRHWGQSAAGAVAASSAAKRIKQSFIGHIYHDRRKIHGCIFLKFSPRPFAAKLRG